MCKSFAFFLSTTNTKKGSLQEKEKSKKKQEKTTDQNLCYLINARVYYYVD